MPHLRLPDRRHTRLLTALLAVLALSACATTSDGVRSTARQVFTAVSSYKSALHYYESGDIMLARRAAMRTASNRPDYPDAQALLKQKIEPARRRLLRHYRLAAVRAEKQGKLYLAKENFLKAAEYELGSTRMQRHGDRIDLILRQRRMNALLEQRRKEDRELLDTVNRYDPPRGLDPKDPTFARELERAQERVQARGRSAWNAAKRELHEGHPEVAYVEAESYQRLRPGSRRGTLLMRDVREAMPKGLKIPSERRYRGSKSSRQVATPDVTSEQIRQLMQQDKWIQARDYAIIYRRNGGDDADVLLQTIDRTLKRQAEAAFRTGQVAFQNEQLDKAVDAWSRAVELQPDNRDYADSLRRASELQESFRILQGKGSND